MPSGPLYLKDQGSGRVLEQSIDYTSIVRGSYFSSPAFLTLKSLVYAVVAITISTFSPLPPFALALQPDLEVLCHCHLQKSHMYVDIPL